jgi:hypothetical protein
MKRRSWQFQAGLDLKPPLPSNCATADLPSYPSQRQGAYRGIAILRRLSVI